MKRFFSMLAVLTFAFASMYGQESATNAYKGKFMNKDLRIQANIDFYNQSIPVPGFELDSCYGFVQGRINGVWIILKVKDVGEKNRFMVKCNNVLMINPIYKNNAISL